MLEAIAFIFFPFMMAYAASSDLLTMTIPNRLTAAVAAAFIPLALATHAPIGHIGLHLACGLLVLLVTFGMFCMGWMGGGDAKLAAATATWLGFTLVLEYVLLASILGGALTLGILMMRQMPLPDVLFRQAWIARLHDRSTGIPYGVALALAALALYPQSSLWKATLAISL